MNAVGVPVMDQHGRVAAALSIAAITERVAPPRLAELVALLQAEAAALGMMIGVRRNRTATTPEETAGGVELDGRP